MAEPSGAAGAPVPGGGDAAPLAEQVVAKPARPKQEKLRPSLFWPLGAVLVPFVRLGSRLRIRNGDRLPATGPYILTPNHHSNVDPVVLAVTVWRLGRAPRFLAKSSLFRVPVLGQALTGTGQIPVERAGSAKLGVPLSAAKRLIREGQGVIVYPEGTLTRDPDLWPMRGKTGAARLALELGIPVIPVAHWGTQGMLPRYSKRLRVVPRSRIDVLFGEPVDLSPWAGRAADPQALTEATARIMAAITGLVEELRGETAPAERWDPRAHGQSESGRL